MLTPNTVLHKRYRIIRQIGSGGMGAVYEAIDERLSSIIAIKETFPQNDATREAFKREAQLLANLDHDVFPKVNDYFSEGEGQYLVMAFVRGNDLGELMRLRESPFATARVLEWADHLLEALEELHAYIPPIVHRDIKPSNLKLTPKGKIVLLDFGIAKGAAGLMTTAEADDNTMKSFTPHYAPLEQSLRSSEELREALSTIDEGAVRKMIFKGTDPRTDIYSLGATLYHLLTGAAPEAASTRAMRLWRGKSDPLRPAAEVNPQVPKEVSEVLERAMQVDRAQRPANAAEMRHMLRAAGGEVAHRAEVLASTFLPPEVQERHKRSQDEKAADRRHDRVGVDIEAERSPAEAAGARGGEEKQQREEEEERHRSTEKEPHEAGEDNRHKRDGEEAIPISPTIAGPPEQQGAQSSSPPDELLDPLPVHSLSRALPATPTPPVRSAQKSRRLLWSIGVVVVLVVVGITATFAITRYVQNRNREEAVETRKKRIEQHAKVGHEQFDRGKWTMAAEEFKEGARLEPEEAQWRVRLADALASAGRIMDAEAEYREGERLARLALQRKPDDASARNALGGAIHGQQFAVVARAETEYREAVRLDPTNASYRTDLAKALFGRSNYAESAKTSREAIRLAPTVAKNYADLASALARQNKYAEAENEYKKAIQLEPSAAFYREWLANLFEDQKKNAEAEAEYKEAERLLREQVQQEPKIAAYHRDLGYFLLRRKKYADAETEFREAARLEPNESSHHSALASLYEDNQEKYTAAESEYREAVRLQPNWAIWHNALGYHYLRRSKYPEAEAAIREAIRLEPMGNYYDSLGDVFKEQNKYAEAEAEYRESLRLVPDFALIHSNLAFALEQQKKYPDAEAEYKEAIRLEPNESRFREGLAGFLYRRTRYAEAESELREAIKLEPNNGSHHSALGYTLEEMKKYKDAEAAFREAVRLGPDIAALRFGLGRFFFARKRYKDAESELREAIRLEPNNGGYHHFLGITLTWLDRNKDAEAEFREAVRLEPSNERYREDLRIVEKKLAK